MEPTSLEIYLPSRLYVRMGWLALAGGVVCALFAWKAPLSLIPAGLCVFTALVLRWFYKRPKIELFDTQFRIGRRAIAWREVREINTGKVISPLILKLKLTNSRHKWLIYPGDPEQIDRLLWQLRKYSFKATFDGVSHQDYWSWLAVAKGRGENPTPEQPVRMLSSDEEDEIERMYQKLKTVGRLDSRGKETKDTED